MNSCNIMGKRDIDMISKEKQVKEVQIYKDILIRGDKALYDINDFEMKLQAYKNISFWNGFVTAFNEEISNIINSIDSMEELIGMYKNANSALPTDKLKNLSTRIFIVAAYRYFRRSDLSQNKENPN